MNNLWCEHVCFCISIQVCFFICFNIYSTLDLLQLNLSLQALISNFFNHIHSLKQILPMTHDLLIPHYSPIWVGTWIHRGCTVQLFHRALIMFQKHSKEIMYSSICVIIKSAIKWSVSKKEAKKFNKLTGQDYRKTISEKVDTKSPKNCSLR